MILTVHPASGGIHFAERSHRMIKLTAVAALAAGLFLPLCAPASAEPGTHNGRWSVELVTETGLCSARYTYALAIREGHVQLISGAAGAQVNGHVGADGSVGLTVNNGTASGTGTGRLRAGSGAGTWKVSSLCSGHWTARRSDTRTAQAD
ncbi:hypothetical protein MCBMB27_00435 [Methylobacterium phyllosphaerae]|uniref:Heme utilization protein n=3 Tax=Methylobacterium TaxID=407 RepID=A0AAE8HRW6_9HYPH|nr:hypothetical protein MCBMB27_00435 [Methylobacterium phyllosphaerae]SFG92610.1 hypothetical protein SAMN05192567_11092 [Methylobacterium phyllosphaerae]